MYIILFFCVLTASVVNKAKDIFGGELFTAFALQGAQAKESLAEDELTKELVSVKYIKEDGSIDESRQIIIYKPTGVSGDLPLIYIPHYAAEENSADFISYIRHGWAVASPYDFKNEYNGILATDDLVFNNAALYELRHMDGIDKKRIAIVGGSAGGYMCMMLNGLQMGTTASIANSPIVNAWFNAHEYFPMCDEINRNSGLFSFTMPIQGLVSKSFQPVNQIIPANDTARWEAVSPIGMARAYSSPVVITHNTSDILVPKDQLTHQYTYEDNDGTLPKGFNAKLPSGYPGILSNTFEELADPEELTVNYIDCRDYTIDGTMPYGSTLITMDIVDDGPTTAKGSHSNPHLKGNVDIFPYLEEKMELTLAGTEKAVPAKLQLLLDRYQGNSLALPAHTGTDDSVYGSLAVYQKEIVDELSVYVQNHSMEELEQAMENAISSADESARTGYSEAWLEIKGKLQ